jgi:ribosomal protein S18 acetylase RimI-like enzyme
VTDGIDTQQLQLRPCTEAEYTAFDARCRAEYSEEIARNMGVSAARAQAKSDADFAKLLPDGQRTADHEVLAIVDAAGELLGNLWMGYSDKLDGREAFGYDFWVRPELRGAGIGRRAMELAAEHAREQGAVRLALNVFGDNERAQHLYRSFGFEVTNVNMAMRLAD